MKELFRDTVVGHAVRIITKGKVMSYEEERDPSIWKRYVDKKKSGQMVSLKPKDISFQRC
jgi:DHA1 family multidrug resistance protein-like MFS transporter